MATSAVSSVTGSTCFLAKDSSSSGLQVKHATADTLATYVMTKTLTGGINNTAISTSGTAVTFKGGVTGPSGGNIQGFGRVYNAVWNDYADFIKIDGFTGIPGKCYVISSDGLIRMSDRYAERGTLGIHSDTFGYCPGGLNPDKDLNSQGLVLGVAGFVLAYVDRDYTPGTPLCAGPDGTLTRMRPRTLKHHPERLVGTYFRREPQKTLYDGRTIVNGRVWVKVK